MATTNSQVISNLRRRTQPPMMSYGMVSVLCMAALSTVHAQKDHQDRGIVLEMGYHLSSGIMTAAFSLTNGTRDPFSTTPVCTNYNRLVIVGPDGKRVEQFTWKDGIPPVVIDAGSSQIWTVNLADMPELKKPGTYRLSWKVGEFESDETIVVRPGTKGEGD